MTRVRGGLIAALADGDAGFETGRLTTWKVAGGWLPTGFETRDARCKPAGSTLVRSARRLTVRFRGRSLRSAVQGQTRALGWVPVVEWKRSELARSRLGMAVRVSAHASSSLAASARVGES